MEIEAASKNDLLTIQRLANIIWPAAYKDILSTHQLQYMLQLIYDIHSLEKQLNEGHQFLLLFGKVYGQRTPIGFASYSRKEPKSPVYRLHKLYVLPGEQGKGSGKFLLNYILDAVKKAGGSSLELNVNRNNAAQYFYHKLGFSVVREEDIDIGHNYFMNDYIMEKKLLYI